MDIEKFKKLPLMGILRGVEPGTIEPLIEAILPTGIGTIEITMDSGDAAKSIRAAKAAAGNRLMVGAGTVMSIESLESALNAGATFIVMPALIRDVVERCVKNIIPVFPGALTPREIYDAWNAGATMVKVFPSGFFGPDYLREVKAPFKNIELMACGGVKADNIDRYFSSGANAVAFGSSIFRSEWLARKDFKSIAAAVKNLIDRYQKMSR